MGEEEVVGLAEAEEEEGSGVSGVGSWPESVSSSLVPLACEMRLLRLSRSDHRLQSSVRPSRSFATKKKERRRARIFLELA